MSAKSELGQPYQNLKVTLGGARRARRVWSLDFVTSTNSTEIDCIEITLPPNMADYPAHDFVGSIPMDMSISPTATA